MDPMTPRPTLQKEYYSDEEAKEILARAAVAPGVAGFSSAELTTFAGEMGISPQQLESAEGAWLAEQGDRALDAERRAFVTARRRKARGDLLFTGLLGALVWASISFSIPVLNVVAAVMMVPLIVITVFTVLEALSAFTETDGEDFEKKLD